MDSELRRGQINIDRILPSRLYNDGKYITVDPNIPSGNCDRHMSYYGKKCPACGNVILPPEVPASEQNGFPCPACGKLLKTSLANLKFSIVIALALSLFLCLKFGLRGLSAIISTLLLLLPLSFVVNSALAAVFPPPFELLPDQKSENKKFR
jgi:hypothetical protein